MKRHESLAPLSREHHQSLILAQILKKDAPVYKGLPEKPGDKAEYAYNMFLNSIEPHFRKEESALAKVKDCHIEIQKLTDEIIYEHTQLTKGFRSLAKSVKLADDMDSLGKALEKHIRKEERVLFPLIEKYCSEKVLAEVQLLLH